jgi:hypothetical protein
LFQWEEEPKTGRLVTQLHFAEVCIKQGKTCMHEIFPKQDIQTIICFYSRESYFCILYKVIFWYHGDLAASSTWFMVCTMPCLNSKSDIIQAETINNSSTQRNDQRKTLSKETNYWRISYPISI